MGSFVDGVRLENNKLVTLENDEHNVKIGNWEHTIK
jgi:hypothetical protein